MLKAIVIAALAIPIIALALFTLSALGFFVLDLVGNGRFSTDWVKLVYAGGIYALIALVVSGVPTLALGLPVSLAAKKYGYLTKWNIIIGASVLGGLFLGVAAALSFEIETVQRLFWFALAGFVGGLINGYTFWRYLERNSLLSPPPDYRNSQ